MLTINTIYFKRLEILFSIFRLKMDYVNTCDEGMVERSLSFLLDLSKTLLLLEFINKTQRIVQVGGTGSATKEREVRNF